MRYFPPVVPAAGTNPNSIVGYAGPERATTYEVGLKSELLDRKLRLNLAAFYTDYKGVQITYNTDPFNTGVPFVPTLANAGNAHIKGLEVESSFAPVKALRIDGSLGYVDAKYVHRPGGAHLVAGLC
jgi:iron complex outermembrane receptor protein